MSTNKSLEQKFNLKVYTEGFRVPILNRRATGCKSIINLRAYEN